MTTLHPTPAVVVGDVLLEATLADGRLTYTLRAPDGAPLQSVPWLGEDGAELLLAGFRCDLNDLVEARRRVRMTLAADLRSQGLSMRAIATQLGVGVNQVLRWLRT